MPPRPPRPHASLPMACISSNRCLLAWRRTRDGFGSPALRDAFARCCTIHALERGHPCHPLPCPGCSGASPLIPTSPRAWQSRSMAAHSGAHVPRSSRPADADDEAAACHGALQRGSERAVEDAKMPRCLASWRKPTTETSPCLPPPAAQPGMHSARSNVDARKRGIHPGHHLLPPPGP